MRKPLIAANWKMHKTRAEAHDFCQKLTLLTQESRADILICPSFTSLDIVAAFAKINNWGLGAQNCHFSEKGAFTGEISLGQLKDGGCTHVLVGHSERRQMFGDTDAVVQKKVSAVLEAGLIPVVCVGETMAQRKEGHTLAILKNQMLAAMEGLTDQLDLQKIVIAYEPIWAIGTGENASAADAEEAIKYLRVLAAEKWGFDSVESNLRILYGGSVKPENAAELGREADIDGALVGGASLEADSFAALVTEFSKG